VAYDEDLAHRIRELLEGEQAVTERKMFGGLGFMIAGHLAVAASHTGGLLVRIAPEDADQALADPHASQMRMRQREPEGWLRVDPAGLRTKRQLSRWLDQSLSFVRTLPPK
jgi:TfoX/Sxy family transcriptional regulator of competence genes